MTPFPHSIEAGADLEQARAMMREHAIRHLPVVDEEERLVGLLSAGDLDRAIFTGVSGAATAGEVCRSPAYAVGLDEPLDNVLLHMARERLGSALVVRQGKVVGIFTATDACLRFAELLRRDLPVDGDDAA